MLIRADVRKQQQHTQTNTPLAAIRSSMAAEAFALGAPLTAAS